MIASPDLWDSNYGREARGVTFDAETGEIVSLPFHKFFNVGERPETQRCELEKHNLVAELKMDGSMITPAIINGKIHLKTKKSFMSDVAVLAQECMPAEIVYLCRYLLERGDCPIFEFTHPDWKVVIDYGNEPTFTLLAVRCMKTGAYYDRCQLERVADYFDVSLVPRTDMFDPETAENIEGAVLIDYDTGFRAKLKTKWYLDRHRMLDFRERDVYDLFMTDKLDDLFPDMLAGEVNMDAVEEIVERAKAQYYEHMGQVDQLLVNIRKLRENQESPKMIWECCSERCKSEGWDRAMLGFAIKRADGKDIDDHLREWVRKKNRGEYTLRSVSNSNFGNHSA